MEYKITRTINWNHRTATTLNTLQT